MKRTVYEGASLNEISFPLGGIGSGCIGLAGNGSLCEWEIFNRPNKKSPLGRSHFAVKAIRNGTVTDARVINGDVSTNLSGGGGGLDTATMQGFPHFKYCRFTGEFPIATVDFSDDTFPGEVTLTAWNPLIPLNDKDSSIPAAFFDYEIRNTTNEDLSYSVCACITNPYDKSVNDYISRDGVNAIFMHQTKFTDDDPSFGDLTVATDTDSGISYQQYLYRGGWFDAVERYWRNFTEQVDFENRVYEKEGGNDGCDLAVRMDIPAGKSKHVHFVISWNRPNCYNYWNRYTEKTADGTEKDVTWKNYYATLFENSLSSAEYSLKNWDSFYSQTMRYHDELFSSTLPEEIVEAIASTVSVLKTPTVMRLENGEFYGWEGVWGHDGSCEGSCTHVWNYAYALCFLFPKLERTIRETDFAYNQDENGRMVFRMQLPLGRQRGTFRACVDGQMGGVIKTYREWKLCGNDEWLKELWPKVKKSLDYAWNENNPDMWDRNRDGVLEGRQHHTLDMELFGPSSWLEGFYLAALKCGAEMAEYLGDTESAELYRNLYEKGHKWTEENLFNGKWYSQKLDLTDRDYLSKFEGADEGYWNSESKEIKYQIGDGCLLDQCLAQWHANINGIGEIFDKDNLHTALKNMVKNNFLQNMRGHYNTFRLFAVNDEPGAIICTFPKEINAPAIPIPYAQESMHGFEYAFAGLLISEGFKEEGLAVVKAIRDRYRGYNRNPFNEIECGFNYARSMASFSLIPIYAGFSFDMTEKAIGFNPILDGDFRTVWFVDSGWGRYSRTEDTTEIKLLSGHIELNALYLPYLNKVTSVTADGKQIPFEFCKETGKLSFNADISESIIIK